MNDLKSENNWHWQNENMTNESLSRSEWTTEFVQLSKNNEGGWGG